MKIVRSEYEHYGKLWIKIKIKKIKVGKENKIRRNLRRLK